jgi:hypothetical protein
MKLINDEWNRIKATGKPKKSPTCPNCGRSDPPSRKGDPEWYSLFSGPKNLEQLAYKVKCAGPYQLLYRPWSGQAHAASTMRNLRESEDAVHLRPIRHPDGIAAVVHFSAMLTLGLASDLIARYAPEKMADAKKRYATLCETVRSLNQAQNLSWRG